MNCKKCKNRIVNFSFLDDTREISAICSCGEIAKWKAKPRKEITLELLTQDPVTAVFEYGILREPTAQELSEKKLFIVKRAIELNLI